MWDKIISLAAQYGPFPVGIVVGMWISKWGIGLQIKFMAIENSALRKEKKNLLDTISALHKRIEILHNKNYH